MNYLNDAIAAIKAAEKVVMSYYNKEKGIKQKQTDIDLVTKADVESEKKIVEFLRKRYPEHGFILEEEDRINKDAEYQWIIDPIDGTSSFAHNYPMFSICIALYRNMSPIVGVVYAPYMKELFYAQTGKGAFLNRKHIKVSGIKTLRAALIGTGFPYSRLISDIDNLNYFNKVAKKAGELRRSGSAAIDICYVACGRLDGYWEIGLKIMDSAAALLVLKEAGGKATDLHGNEVKEDFSNIVASNGIIHDELLRTLREAE